MNTNDKSATTHRRAGRRKALTGVGAIVAAPYVIGSQARAQAVWPTKPVKYINPFPAGGATDTLSRLFCQKMSEVSGQQWVVENVGGGGGDIGVNTVARSQPDGYTLGLGGGASHAISPTLKAGKLPFDPERDFTFITNIFFCFIIYRIFFFICNGYYVQFVLYLFVFFCNGHYVQFFFYLQYF